MRYPLLAALATLILAGSGCSEDLAEERTVIQKDKVAVEVGKDVEILYSDSAVVRVRIKAPVMYNYLDREDPRQEFPAGVQIDFFDAGRNIQSSLTAKTAMRSLTRKMVTIRDSVVWQSVRNETLHTEELLWNEQENVVSTRKFVRITRPGEKMFGYDFKSNQDFSRWELSAGSGWVKSNDLTKDIQ